MLKGGSAGGDEGRLSPASRWGEGEDEGGAAGDWLGEALVTCSVSWQLRLATRARLSWASICTRTTAFFAFQQPWES